MTYKCSGCNYKHNNKSRVEKHLMRKKCAECTIIESEEEIIFICNKCSQRYKSKSGLNYHLIKCLKSDELKEHDVKITAAIKLIRDLLIDYEAYRAGVV
jgi:hypothetical protein